MKSLFTFAIVMLLPCCVVLGQEQSAEEAAAIKAITDSGGRVAQISASDEKREVSFYLSDKPIGDEQLIPLTKIGNIVWLNLANTKISNDGLKHIANLPLTKLHLEKTEIGDDGLKHLANLKDLTYLNLYSTKVSDAGLQHLKNLKNLKKLYVWQSQVTPEGMAELNKTLTGTEIVGEIQLSAKVVEVPMVDEVEVKLDLSNVKCMLMPNKNVDEKFFAEFNGGKVYFCCAGCLGKFNKDMEKYTAAANEQLVRTKQFKQKACPLTGTPAKDDQVVKINELEVKVCCGNCKGKLDAAADDAARALMVFSPEAFKKGFEKAN